MIELPPYDPQLGWNQPPTTIITSSRRLTPEAAEEIRKQWMVAYKNRGPMLLSPELSVTQTPHQGWDWDIPPEPIIETP